MQILTILLRRAVSLPSSPFRLHRRISVILQEHLGFSARPQSQKIPSWSSGPGKHLQVDGLNDISDNYVSYDDITFIQAQRCQCLINDPLFFHFAWFSLRGSLAISTSNVIIPTCWKTLVWTPCSPSRSQPRSSTCTPHPRPTASTRLDVWLTLCPPVCPKAP